MDLASSNALRSLSVDEMSGRAAFCGTITPMAHPIAGGYYNSESRANIHVAKLSKALRRTEPVLNLRELVVDRLSNRW
jgi:hypothetical protein